MPVTGSNASLPFRQSIDGALDRTIGRYGLAEAELGLWLARLEPELERLRADYATGRLPLLRIPEQTADLAQARAAMGRLTEGAQTVVIFGTGGSSLGGQTLAQFSGWHTPGGGNQNQQRPRLRFHDNLDPHSLDRALAALDLVTTRFIVISKSGNTPETLVQALAALHAVEAAGLAAEVARLFLGLTEPATTGCRNGLRSLFAGRNIPLLDHHTGIGGRYSVLTNVGLLPALARDLDVEVLRAGARDVVALLLSARGPADLPAAIGAALNVALAAPARGIRIQVMMPYSDRLGRFASWFVQLWAESLGKNGRGTTPIACLGPLDQHSQLQLFMDGPREHLLTVLRVPTRGAGPRIDPELANAAGLSEMAGRSVGDLVAAQAHGVPEALARAGRPVRTFDLARLDERTLGALLMHFILETILAARLWGVDPFDQPAVELGKTLSRERLSDSG
jgi:glucose-6-phosphate isomerase